MSELYLFAPDGAELDPEHRRRLTGLGVPAELLDSLDLRAMVDADLPDWWPGSRSGIYLTPDAEVPTKVIDTLTLYPFEDVVIVIASPNPNLDSMLVGGSRATVFLGPDSAFTCSNIYCGIDSSIVLLGHTTATRCAIIDARNGGSIFAEPGQLWAADVYVATDDMHRINDLETGARLNPFGAHIRLGPNVWLCKDVIVSGNAEIGGGTVIGARSIVRNQKVPDNVLAAGVPAAVIREGITWDRNDVP